MRRLKWQTVPGGLTGPTHLKRATLDDGTVVEMWDDPRWTRAVKQLKRGKTAALGRLMRAERQVPEDITAMLAAMLDPPSGYLGIRLRVSGKIGPRRLEKRFKLLGERLAVHRELRDAGAGKRGQFEAALETVANARKKCRLPRSHGYLTKCWKHCEKEHTFSVDACTWAGVVGPRYPASLRGSDCRRQSILYEYDPKPANAVRPPL
jgi:hypothetical protein